MSQAASEFVGKLADLSGFTPEKLQAIGFREQAGELILRGMTPEVCAQWLEAVQIIVVEIEQEKSVDMFVEGFELKIYSGQDGVFLRKEQEALRMPYMNEHIVDEEIVHAESKVVVEVYPDRRVVTNVEDSDYLEEQLDFLSDEGWALLKDAMC